MTFFALTIDGETEYLPADEKDKAMRLYYEAYQGGDTTAKLVEVDSDSDGPTPPTTDTDDDDDPDDPPPAPPPAIPSATPPGLISEIARYRIKEQDKWLKEAGFSLAPPLFVPGTRVLPLGDENFRLERRRVQQMPTFPAAAEHVIEQIQAEERRDITVQLDDLTMNEKGQLSIAGATDGPLGVEALAFQQLATLTGFGMGGRYLQRLCPPALRATNVNHQFSHRPNRRVVLRTRLGPEETRQVFSTVTPTYAAVDTDAVLEAVCESLSDAHTEMRYDGQHLYATALWMPDEVQDLAAGDVFKVGVRIETDDTGRGRIRISGVAFRNRCLNLIIIGEGEVETVSLVHRGDTVRILSLVREGVATARKTVGNFLDAWGHARTVKVDPKKTLREWVENKTLKLKTRQSNEVILDELWSAWKKEPGDSLADAVNAVTRAAHESERFSLDLREALERQAARLVLVSA